MNPASSQVRAFDRKNWRWI